MDQSQPKHPEKGVPKQAPPVGAFKQGNPEKGIIGGGGKVKFGRRPRPVRLSISEDQLSGDEEWLSGTMEASGSYGKSPKLQGMQVEATWPSRTPMEKAEINYQRWLAANGPAPLSSSPRSPNTKYMTFQSRRPRGPEQDQGNPVTVKASGTPHRGRNRTSSESEKGARGSKKPTQRRRGLSETESRPKWDNTKMSGLQCLASENIWFDKQRYDDAEKCFYEGVNGPSTRQQQVKTALQAKARPQKRQHRNSSSHGGGDQELVSRMKSLELENQTLHQVVETMRATMQKLESRVAVLEKTPASAAVPCAKAAPVKQVNGDDDDDDDDMDLFGSDDEEDEEAERLKQERIDAYAAKKGKKPTLIAKSSILLDVKPWDDETDMAKLEECVRSVQMDGLLWGQSKLLPVGYGIRKLQINCVVEDDKVGTDILEEEITKFEDFIQSVDVAAFNKI